MVAVLSSCNSAFVGIRTSSSGAGDGVGDGADVGVGVGVGVAGCSGVGVGSVPVAPVADRVSPGRSVVRDP